MNIGFAWTYFYNFQGADYKIYNIMPKVGNRLSLTRPRAPVCASLAPDEHTLPGYHKTNIGRTDGWEAAYVAKSE